MYIWQHKAWPHFRWDHETISNELALFRLEQGRLIGRMEGLGFELRREAYLRALTEETRKSSAIEGENLDEAQVRSSIARSLRIKMAGLVPSSHYIDGVVEMMLDATGNCIAPLTKKRLFGWHAALFPAGRSGMHRIAVAQFRDDRKGPMQVVSGGMGRERVHYEAPPADRLRQEFASFLYWLEKTSREDLVLKSGIAHLWFLTLHPFDDGNGRIARAIADMLLARSENNIQRFYSVSSQIESERKGYYRILEKSQKGSLDISEWLDWYLGCLRRAIARSQLLTTDIIEKADFWSALSKKSVNKRQQAILKRLIEGFEGKLSTSKYAKLAKCSQDTAYRDILDLVEQGLLRKAEGGGRSTSYVLAKNR